MVATTKKTNLKELQQLPDKTFTLTVTLPQKDIQTEYQNIIKEIAQNFETKGFRKGKAPLDVVEKQISPEKITEQLVENLLTQTYRQKTKQFNLNPITSPKVKLLNPPLTLEKDWQFEITSCETPVVKIDPKYQDKIKQSNNKKNQTKEETTNKILDIISESCTLKLPQIIIENEIEHRLSHLIEQIDKANLTLDKYFESNNSNLENYKLQQTELIKKEWTLNLALDQIASNQKIETNSQEIENIAKNYPPEKKIDLNLLSYLIRQQKTLEFLSSLK